jgi:hypothetical protein
MQNIVHTVKGLRTISRPVGCTTMNILQQAFRATGYPAPNLNANLLYAYSVLLHIISYNRVLLYILIVAQVINRFKFLVKPEISSPCHKTQSNIEPVESSPHLKEQFP